VPGRKPDVAVRAAGRFESCAIRPGEASRVSDDGSGPENRRGGSPWEFEPPSLRSRMRNPTGDGTGFETRRALPALQVRLLPHPLVRSSSGQSA
jgi:hypothetical protein